ncbi:clumping factor A-like [Argopecten irradians]|uniref:clumping factor A-like n=1 Tax=Argopecten irradians TaxID=31199 RepID=UPI003714CB50
MTPVSRFYVSDSDSSCIDWSDEKKPSTAAVENKIKAGEKEGSDQEDNLPGMTTNGKTVVEKRSAYSDWDSGDDEGQEGKTTLTKDVKDILQLHENHKRWESSSKSDVTEENTTFVAKPVKKNPRYKRPDKERDITSSPGKPTVEDNVLDLVLASGSDWDSDNSEISLNEVSKSEGKRNSCQNPKTGIFLQNEGIPELALTGKKTYAVAYEIYSPGGSNSHWDSDTGLLFEEKNAIKLSSAVNNHTESSESAAQDITEEKPTFSQNNPALKEVELSIVRKSNAESDWDSDESQKSSIHAAECDNGEGGKLSDINDSSDKPAERNLDFDSDWDNDESEKPSTGVNNDLVDDPNICTNTVVNKYTEDEGNPHPALNEDVVAYETCAVTDVDLKKEHSPGSDSDWDSDVGSLLEEPVKENTEKLQPDLSLAGDTHTESTPIADHDVTKDDPGPTLPVVTEITDPGESCHVLISPEDKASRKELDVVQNLNSDSDLDSDESEEHPDNVTKGENIEKKNIPSEGRGSADVKNEMDFFNDDSKSETLETWTAMYFYNN